MRIAVLTTDNRDHHRRYDLTEPHFGTAPEALLQGFSALPEAEVHVVSCTQRQMESPDKLASNIWFHSLHVPKIGWLRTGYQGCIRATRKFLRELRPDIVHGQGTERDCAISAVFSGFPNVVTLHGIMQEQAQLIKVRPGSFYWLATQIERITLPKTFGVFCNSKYTESILRNRTRRTWLVPNAIRKEFFKATDSRIPQPSKPVLLNIGVICARKRQLALLDLAQELHRQGDIFELQFIGSANARDNYAATFLSRIKSAEESGFARYHGAMTLPQLIEHFDTASALIHVPSEEAFGLVVAEALARNLKFFGTSVGGITDIANGVEAAELFPLGDSTALGNAICNWLRSGVPRPQSASAEMRLRYHPDVIATRHLEIYREVLSKSS